MITPEYIKSTVEEYFDLEPGSIDSKSRKTEIVEGRHIATFFTREMIRRLSIDSIGKQIGKRTYSSALHSLEIVNDLIDSDKHFRDDVDEIRRRLNRSVVKRVEKQINNIDDQTEMMRTEIKLLIVKLYGEGSTQEKIIDMIFCCD
jgi:hypothetical protein